MRNQTMPRRCLKAFCVLFSAVSLAAYSRAQDAATREPAPSRATASASSENRSPGKTSRSNAENKSSARSQRAPKPKAERATFGAGCFWHVEADFERLQGVNWAVSGYAGGDVPNPTYEMVHEGFTGHAEVVMVEYDPSVISYDKLLNVFWSCHDPTTLNRQGPDIGPQYRSVIFYHNDDQRDAALRSYRELSEKRVFRSPIVTEIAPLRAFYRAEDYHQDYYGGKPRAASRRRSSASKAKKSNAKRAGAAPAVKPAARSDQSEPAANRDP
jgi:peptide-methionine (S)-S-oxide reductase